MHWKIERVFSFPPGQPWGGGQCHYGFHGASGALYALMHGAHWLGRLAPDDTFLWTAGAVNPGLSPVHMAFPLKHPYAICELPDGSQLVSSHGTNQIFRLRPDQRCADLFADTGRVGLKDLGSCVYDGRESIWVNEITGCRVWRFELTGEPVQVLGSGQPGFQPGAAPFEDVLFSVIYDMRAGPDGCLYVLDSLNYCVRRIDPVRQTVSVVVGTGQPGYTGDGGPAVEATLGSSPGHAFDGPYALAIDEAGDLFIGDAHNGVVREVDSRTGRIETIAGGGPAVPGTRIETRESNPRGSEPRDNDPTHLYLPQITSLDYYAGRLYITDASGDLVVLRRD